MSEAVKSMLVELAREVRIAEPSEDLTTAVLARLADEPAPGTGVRSWVSARWRWIMAALAALVGAGLVVSPVGAEIGEWFGFHGVVVSEEAPSTDGEPTVPSEPNETSLAEAAVLVGFTPVVPTELGPPDGVSVSADRAVLSLSWGHGEETVRLDEFDGSVEPSFWKATPYAERVTVSGGDALWLPIPHDVVLLPHDGGIHTLAPRRAAQTLVWLRGQLTLRLEGQLSQERAIEIAESAG